MLRLTAIVTILLVLLGVCIPAAGFAPPVTVGTGHVSDREPAVDLASLRWEWPAAPFRLARPFIAPPHEYGPGHRGIDLDLLGGVAVLAPADGVVAFSGSVAGRGILTIDHGDGLVTTLEPVESVLAAGVAVRRSQEVATLAVGGHSAPGTLHFGVRLHGAYINPMLLLGGVPRAVLLPCCD
jgi:murein DD-endopeptidase MepM/ murein hydrolase activator NlpD